MNIDKDKEECTICLEPLTAKEMTKLDCGHVYHSKCFTDYVLSRNQSTITGDTTQTVISIDCPLCRALVSITIEPESKWSCTCIAKTCAQLFIPLSGIAAMGSFFWWLYT